MAFQTTAGILARLAAVLEASPCSLTASPTPFSVETVAAAMVNVTYRLRAAGVTNERGLSNYAVARMERFEVTLQRRLDFDAYDAQEDLQTVLDTVERAVIADGPNNSYSATVEKGSRKVTRPKNADVAEAAIVFLCDYDFNELAS